MTSEPVTVEVIVPPPEPVEEIAEEIADNLEIAENAEPPVYEPGNALDFEHRITVLEGQMALLVPVVTAVAETAESAVDIADVAAADAAEAVDVVVNAEAVEAVAVEVSEPDTAEESADAVIIESEPDALPEKRNLSDRYYGKVRLPWQH